MDWIQTVIIAIVEGLTEFLPVSSTGHMIITQHLLGVPQGDAFVHAFTFIIQFGAILSVVCLYWKRFFRFDNTPAPEGSTWWQCLKHKYYFYWLLIVGVIPAVVIGLLAKKSGLLDWLLDSVLVVAIMLVVGGVFMLYCDRLFNKGSEANKVNEKRAFRIGLFQCISVIPGVSRSMATIVGTARKNENSAAFLRVSPCAIPPTMVAIERDTPGMTEMHWNKPIINARCSFTLILSLPLLKSLSQ
jgi:undecaprenyl-diphosphatase